jgi:hypothetical protein
MTSTSTATQVAKRAAALGATVVATTLPEHVARPLALGVKVIL